VPEIISKCCELVKLCQINRSIPIFFLELRHTANTKLIRVLSKSTHGCRSDERSMFRSRQLQRKLLFAVSCSHHRCECTRFIHSSPFVTYDQLVPLAYRTE